MSFEIEIMIKPFIGDLIIKKVFIFIMNLTCNSQIKTGLIN